MRSWGMREGKKKQDKWLLAIGLFKVVKAALLIALGIGLSRLFHRDISDELESWIRRLNLDAHNPLLQAFPAKVESMNSGKLPMLSAGAFIYAGLFTAEGVGLLREKRWGEYLTIFITGSFLPFEIYELAKKFNWFRLLLLVGNAAILGYLIWKVVSGRKKQKA